jgi:hypothetical protein
VIAIAWILAALLSTLVGLLQYFGQTDWVSPWVNATPRGIAYGNLRQRNQFATLTTIGLSAVLFWGVPAAVTRNRLWVVWGLTVLLAVGNASSSSRTGLTQLMVLSGMAFIWRATGRNRCAADSALWTCLLLAWGSYVLACWFLPVGVGLDHATSGILGRMQDEMPSCSSRIALWSNVLHLIGLQPWTGWGWGNLDYAHFTTIYPQERFCDLLDNAHNLPLHLAVELGVPVALCVCGVMVWLLAIARPWGETNAIRRMAWSVLAVVGLHSLLEYPLWYGPFQLAVVASLSMLWCSRGAPGNTNRERRANGCPTIRQRVIRAVMATGMLSACAYAAWDYWRVSQLYLPVAERHAAYREDTLEKVRSTWLFQDQVLFAELTTTPLTRSNAQHIHATALQLLHFSPEPRVVEKLIESAVMLDRDDEALFYLLRYKAAYPQEHARWAQASASHKAP